ncbi:hypothetical protein TKK_0007319 [Trichogramma kaykai]
MAKSSGLILLFAIGFFALLVTAGTPIAAAQPTKSDENVTKFALQDEDILDPTATGDLEMMQDAEDAAPATETTLTSTIKSMQFLEKSNETDANETKTIQLGLNDEQPFDQQKQGAQALLNVDSKSINWSDTDRFMGPFRSVGSLTIEKGQEDTDPILSNSTQQLIRSSQQTIPFLPSTLQDNFVRFVKEKEEASGAQNYQINKPNSSPWIGTTNFPGATEPYQRQGKPNSERSSGHISMYEENEENSPLVPHAMNPVDDNFYRVNHHQNENFEKPTKFHAVGYVMPLQNSQNQQAAPDVRAQQSQMPQAAIQQQKQYNTIPQHENLYAHYQPNQFDPMMLHDRMLYSKPETIINVHPISYQASSIDLPTKPKAIMFFTSHDMRPLRNYHQNYNQHPLFDQAAAGVANIEHHIPYIAGNPIYIEPQQKSLSPWKKILHIIGAFLPLGLLFALLTPKMPPPSQNNDANIILSKFRGNDPSIEHKNNNYVLDAVTGCEEHSICRLIATVDSSRAAFLRQLLEQVTEKTTESAVRKKELDRIFEAAKLGNCDILTCNFNDNT